MKKMNSRMAVYGFVALFAAMAHAEVSFVLTNTNTAAEQTFTNSLGSAVQTNGMIVFEGELKSNMAVPKAYNGASGYYLASLQLLAQVKLFDELPLSNDVNNAQGAVAALKDSPAATTGKFFAWGVTNSAPATWIPLMQTNNTQFVVNDGATNYITFVFYYPTTATNVTYQVFIGDVASSVREPSLDVVSSTVETNGINGVSLLGTGGLTQVASASGQPGPLSSSIGFSVYATSKGILLVVDTANEKGTGPIIVYALINGVWTEVGRVIPDGSNHYEILASGGLAVGQSYAFKIQDEVGHSFTLNEPVEVKAIKMDSVSMTADCMVVTFNSEPGRTYQVLVADSLSASEWTPEVVRYPIAGGEGYGSEAFTVIGTSTTIKIPMPIDIGNKPKRFFKIIKTN